MIAPDTQTRFVVALLGLLGSGLGWLIKRQSTSIKILIESAERQARIELKVDTMWAWFTNHGSDITGYKKEQP